jgi:glycosyltransferase involved in cell wall biosynthesis
VKILHVVHGYPPEVIGGTELYVARLVREQRRAGHEPHVFAGSLEWRKDLEVERGVVDDVPVTRVHRNDLYFDRWDKGYHPGVSQVFERHIGSLRPDLVHVHHWIRLSTNLVAIATRLGVRAVVTAHDLYPSCPRVFRLKGTNGDEPCERPMSVDACLTCVPRWRFQRDPEITAAIRRYRADMLRELELAACVITPSTSHGTFLGRMLGYTAAQLVTLPHGSLEETPRTAPARGADGKLHVAYWSHLHPLKGAHVLLEAVRRCARRDRLAVHLHGEASSPEYKERLELLAEGSDVHFHGRFRVADLEGATMDVAVIPTLARESYSFILDEATLFGVPILAAAAGALAERATGRVLTFVPNDADDLARKLALLVDEPGRLDAMRTAEGPRLATFVEHASRLEAIYADALRRPTPPPPVRDDAERLRDEWNRRETAFQELVRIEKWEDIVAEQRRRIHELEDALRARVDAPPK